MFIILFQYLFFLGALVALYEEAEKPNNAAEFVRRFMGASGPDSAETESLKNELMIIREKTDELVRENETLKEKLQKYESGQ
jgi:two-component SAPR family response regulator